MLARLSEILGANPQLAWPRLRAACGADDRSRLPATYAKMRFDELGEVQAKKIMKAIDSGVISPEQLRQIGRVSGTSDAAATRPLAPPPARSRGVATGTSSATSQKPRWTKNEEIRLVCCLLDNYDREGCTFLEYLKRPPTRAELNVSKTPAEDSLAQRFNNPQMAWPHLAHILALRSFDPTAVGKLNLPRHRDDIISRFKDELMMQVKAFLAAYKQSGKNRIDLWEWGHYPVAEIIYRTQPNLLQLISGSMLQIGEGNLIVRNAELGLTDDDDTGGVSAQDEEAQTPRSTPRLGAQSPVGIFDDDDSELHHEVKTPDFDLETPARRSSTTSRAEETVLDSGFDDEDEFELRGTSEQLSTTSTSESARSTSKRRRAVLSTGMSSTTPLNDISSISQFIATNGSAFVSSSRKKQCLSDSQTRLALSTYQGIKHSEGAQALANAMQNLANALSGLSRK